MITPISASFCTTIVAAKLTTKTFEFLVVAVIKTWITVIKGQGCRAYHRYRYLYQKKHSIKSKPIQTREEVWVTV